VAAATAAILLVPAAPASAVPGLSQVFELGATSSANLRITTGACPAGTSVIGGGYVYPATARCS
jgi:hypothetical protein